MDYKHIETLLDKYFEGETSLQEEQQLKHYFTQEPVHESLRSYQPLFRLFVVEKHHHLDDSFDEALLRQLEKTDKPVARIRRLNTWALRVAAMIALALGIWWIYPVDPPAEKTAAIDWSKFEPETVEEAYEITRTALLRTSSELNRGASKAAVEVSKVKKMNEVFR